MPSSFQVVKAIQKILYANEEGEDALDEAYNMLKNIGTEDTSCASKPAAEEEEEDELAKPPYASSIVTGTTVVEVQWRRWCIFLSRPVSKDVNSWATFCRLFPVKPTSSNNSPVIRTTLTCSSLRVVDSPRLSLLLNGRYLLLWSWV